MANLVLLMGGEATPFPIANSPVVLGRHPDCDVQLQSNMVSRKHAQVVRDEGRYYVEDLGSGNGTFVNGQPIEKRTALKHQDRIKLGPVLLRFEADGVDGEALADSVRGSGSTVSFKLDISSGDQDNAAVMETLDNAGGFGMLDVRPEAKLKGVIEITRSLAGMVDLESILPKVLDTLFEIFPQADRGSILLKNDAGVLIPAVQKHRRSDEDETVKLSRTVLNRVMQDKTAILSADAANDSRWVASESISTLTIRSMMCVPLLSHAGEPMGVINLDTQNAVKQFKKDDLDLLLAVAGQAALSYESARLLASHIEKQKQDQEMRIARNVQQALLPEDMPQVAGWEFYASYDAAQAVGGDYYDCFLLDDGKICLSFGDVAGKGVPAALVMSRMSSVVRSTLCHVHDVGSAVNAINNHMCSGAVEGRFVTYVLAIIDLRASEVELAIAGHMSPLIRKPDGTIEEFDEDSIGVPIGVISNYPFDVISRSIAPGETVLIYTDGVSEAMNPDGKLYSEKKVRDFLKSGPKGAAELGKALLSDVRKHANGRAQNDDITIMAFSRS